MNAGVTFTEPSARRIAELVRRMDSMPAAQSRPSSARHGRPVPYLPMVWKAVSDEEEGYIEIKRVVDETGAVTGDPETVKVLAV